MSDNLELTKYVRPNYGVSPIFSNILDSFFNRSDFNDIWDNRHSPVVNDEGNRFISELELPGFKKDEVKVSFDNGYLNISAQKKDKNSAHSYSNIVYIGDNVNEEKVTAKLEDGVLRVELVKVKDTTPKYIDVT